MIDDAATRRPTSTPTLRAERDIVHARLGEAVGALETIRLNLLRLHAGSATVEGSRPISAWQRRYRMRSNASSRRRRKWKR